VSVAFLPHKLKAAGGDEIRLRLGRPAAAPLMLLSHLLPALFGLVLLAPLPMFLFPQPAESLVLCCA
jgi:hypothetical protein